MTGQIKADTARKNAIIRFFKNKHHPLHNFWAVLIIAINGLILFLGHIVLVDKALYLVKNIGNHFHNALNGRARGRRDVQHTAGTVLNDEKANGIHLYAGTVSAHITRAPAAGFAAGSTAGTKAKADF